MLSARLRRLQKRFPIGTLVEATGVLLEREIAGMDGSRFGIVCGHEDSPPRIKVVFGDQEVRVAAGQVRIASR